MKNTFAILALIAICFTSCKKDDGSTGDFEADPNIVVATNIDNVLLLKLINEKRTAGCKCGTTVMPPVPAVTWNNLIASAASAHSKDMNANKFFAHESSSGKTTGYRLITAGYNWKSYTENLASGFTTEQAVVDGWLASEGHCKNLMSSLVKETGAAREGIYWTQDFASK
jgi:uncharacterized protein YkwD